MGLFGQIMGSAVEKLTKDKEQREREKAYVRNNEGSKAICAYMAHLFQKGLGVRHKKETINRK